jgi:hypothetical protein
MKVLTQTHKPSTLSSHHQQGLQQPFPIQYRIAASKAGIQSPPAPALLLPASSKASNLLPVIAAAATLCSVQPVLLLAALAAERTAQHSSCSTHSSITQQRSRRGKQAVRYV